MSLLLALAEAPVVDPPEVEERFAGGWYAPEQRRKKKREEWQDALEAIYKPEEQPVEAEEPKAEKPPKVAPYVSNAGQKYVDALLAEIAEAQRQQELARRQMALAVAVQIEQAAQARLAEAIAAEQEARRQMRMFDIAFVAAVLSEL